MGAERGLTTSVPRDLIAETRERFIGDTEKHEMKVLLDDGLYRHIQFRKPGTVTYGFSLLTWPGYLAVVGDCGDYVFSRTADMFEFFGPSGARGGFEDASWGINPQYWSEKLQAPRPDAALQWSRDLYRQCVLDWLAERGAEMDPDEAASLRGEVADRLLGDQAYDEAEAHRLLYDFEHAGVRIYEAWEWNMHEYDWAFLWCCWAIVWGIGVYRGQDKDFIARQETSAYLLSRKEFAQ